MHELTNSRTIGEWYQNYVVFNRKVNVSNPVTDMLAQQYRIFWIKLYLQ